MSSSPSFNPTRVHLEPSWYCSRPETAKLQPHEGASGTRSPSTSRVAPSLQPHEGASGTAPHGIRFSEPSLQPHEGASGTRDAHLMIESDVVASTPRGCIWNAAGGSDRRTLSASTPRGCIWNRSGDCRATGPASFNPTRVHLEQSRRRPAPGLVAASTPRGCIWNSPPISCPRRSAASFNPTRVHLEQAPTGLGEPTPPKLQPHEGASGTIDASPINRSSIVCFNPTRVHLEREWYC